MNNFLTKIKSSPKIINKFFKINPHKHWVFLLYFFFIIVSCLILFSLFLLYEIKSDQIFQVEIKQPEKQNLLQQDLLKNTTDLYNQKAKSILQIKNNKTAYDDPSL